MSFGFLFDPAKTVASLVEKWRPDSCKTEKQYEDSLYEFLHRELADVQVTRQYPRGRNRVDMLIGDKVALELKNNLQSKNEYHRLVGQLTEIRSWDMRIVVVLTGDTDPHYPKALLDTVKDWDEYFLDPKVRVVVKTA